MKTSASDFFIFNTMNVLIMMHGVGGVAGVIAKCGGRLASGVPIARQDAEANLTRCAARILKQ